LATASEAATRTYDSARDLARLSPAKAIERLSPVAAWVRPVAVDWYTRGCSAVNPATRPIVASTMIASPSQ
jgi:hypothetical protein